MTAQRIEIIPAEDGSIDAVLLERIHEGNPAPEHVYFAMRLVPNARLDAALGENWSALVVCHPAFAKKHKATPATSRPRGHRLQFMAAAE